MPVKHVDIEGLGLVRLYKRRDNRNLRLSIDASGNPRVSLPFYVPYREGVKFAKSNKAWIISHAEPRNMLLSGQAIGRKYVIEFSPSAKVKAASFRINGRQISVKYPSDLYEAHLSVQAAARRGAAKAIKQEAENTLPGRLSELAQVHGYKYNKVRIKALKRRWGSCSSDGNISLNMFLVCLEPELIDYVLLHELAHTIHQHHQAAFWQELEAKLPGAKELRAKLRGTSPSLNEVVVA